MMYINKFINTDTDQFQNAYHSYLPPAPQQL